MTVYSQTFGQGKNLVLFHGWGFDSRIMEPLAILLAKVYRVTLIDLPGFGRSDFIGENYHLDYLVEILKPIIPKQSVFIGWSLGGLIAMKLSMALTHSKGVILLASTPCFVAVNTWPGIPLNLLSRFHDSLMHDSEDIFREFVFLQMNKAQYCPQSYAKIKKLLCQKNDHNRIVLQGGLNILKNTDLRRSHKNIQTPVHYFFGEKDALISVDTAVAIKKIYPEASIHIIPDYGHSTFLLAPEFIFKEIRKIVSE